MPLPSMPSPQEFAEVTATACVTVATERILTTQLSRHTDVDTDRFPVKIGIGATSAVAGLAASPVTNAAVDKTFSFFRNRKAKKQAKNINYENLKK